jgi:hypothetical protein
LIQRCNRYQEKQAKKALQANLETEKVTISSKKITSDVENNNNNNNSNKR